MQLEELTPSELSKITIPSLDLVLIDAMMKASKLKDKETAKTLMKLAVSECTGLCPFGRKNVPKYYETIESHRARGKYKKDSGRKDLLQYFIPVPPYGIKVSWSHFLMPSEIFPKTVYYAGAILGTALAVHGLIMSQYRADNGTDQTYFDQIAIGAAIGVSSYLATTTNGLLSRFTEDTKAEINEQINANKVFLEIYCNYLAGEITHEEILTEHPKINMHNAGHICINIEDVEDVEPSLFNV